MKKFQFSLDTVLRYKQQVLDGLQNEYAAAALRVQQQEERLRQAEASYRDQNREFRAAAAEGITIADAMSYESGLRVLEKQIQTEEETLRRLQAEAEEKRLKMVAARQETASLEKLRDHKLEDYQKQVQKQEEQFIDELVSTKRVMAAHLS